jgi:hypothetical protein
MKKLMVIVVFLLTSNGVKSQVDKSNELFLKLKIQDSIFFERGFNQCDFTYLEAHIAKSFTFYHDQGGIQDRELFFENTRKNICANSIQKPIRKVDEKSLEVFPLYDNGKIYGAIQTGIHDFYKREKNKEDVHTSRAKFTHVWLLESGKWILKEVLSFDHK